MIGIGGKFYVGAKGMVAVPDISTLTPDAAEAAISSAGLVRGAVSIEQTSNSSLGNKVYYQSLIAGVLVDYESVLAFNYRIYIPPSTPQPILEENWAMYTVSTGYDCATDGSNLSLYYEITENRKYYYLKGIITADYVVDANSRQKIYPEGANAWKARDGVCKYFTPSGPICDPEKNWTATSSFVAACSNCVKVTTQRYVNSCPGVADKLVKTSVSCCCTASTVCGAWSAYVGGGSSRTCTTTNSDCTTKTFVENRCIAATSAWKNSGSCVNKLQKQTRTITSTNCTVTTETRSISCTGGAI